VASWQLNGLPVMQGKVMRPRVGNWVAELQVDAATVASIADGALGTLKVDQEVVLTGTVLRSGAYVQNVTLRIVGGRNGLSRLVKPRFYRGVQLAQVLQDILADAGETLSGTSTPEALAKVLGFWAQVEQPAAEALTSLAETAGAAAVWRLQPDGGVFLGVDGFPPSALVDFDLVESMPLEGLQVIATEAPDVHPGERFNDRNVSAVEHLLMPDGSRVRLFYE
jgi:hypothetical protein